MDKYTKFILTVIAVAMIGILFKGEKVISPAHAVEFHKHKAYEIYDLESKVRDIVNGCRVSEGFMNNYEDGSSILNTWKISC